MSYVVTIKARSGKPTLSRECVSKAVSDHPSWTWNGDEQLLWSGSEGTEPCYLNFVGGGLWTDCLSRSGHDEFLEAMRCLAVSLEADLVGEEGESLLDASAPDSDGTSILKVLVMLPLGILVLPILAVLFVLRLPWIMWQIVHPKDS